MRLPLYIVNLQEQVSRRHFMELQVSELPDRFQVEFVNAVNGRLLSPQQIKAEYDPTLVQKMMGRELTRGEIGCAMSHRMIYQQIISRNEPAAIILEDDIGLERWFPEVVEAMITRLNLTRRQIVLMSDLCCPSLWKSPLFRHYKLVRAKWETLSCGYIITQAAAKSLLDAQTPIRFAADWWAEMEQQGLIETWGIEPKCVFKSLFDSNTSIGGARGSRSRSFLVRVRNKLHRLWFQVSSWAK